MEKLSYTTIKQNSECSLKEKGSEFIAEAYPVENEEQTAIILNDIRKQYYDASHHCYAIKLVNNFTKYSDDGEPGGTAGVKILNAIDHFQLNNILLVVIRYFGGTKLGVGPLGKAYYNAAKDALEKASFIKMNLYTKISITSEFSNISIIHRLLEYYKVKKLNINYQSDVTFEFYIEPVHYEPFSFQLKEASNGAIIAKQTGESLFLETIE